MTNTIRLPEYAEWIDSPLWNEHLRGQHAGTGNEACPDCITQPMLASIHEAHQAPGLTNDFMDAVWAEADGYGEPGYLPEQGWDWSGIRDSSPAATKRMYDICVQWGRA